MEHEGLYAAVDEQVSAFYEGGQGLRGNALKNYTSGDGSHKGFEGLVNDLILMAVDHFHLNDQVTVNGQYFKPDHETDNPETDDPQRMDHHIWVLGEVPLVVESRAWIDKPFYTLKRAVVRNFMLLPYVNRQLTQDVKFLFVALQADVTDRTVKTLDRTLGFGDRVTVVRFSLGHRSGKQNYFDWGVNKEGVKAFTSFLCESLARRSESCWCSNLDSSCLEIEQP